MNEKIIQKVATCSTEGKMQVAQEVDEWLQEQEEEELARIPEGEERWRKMLQRAQMHLQEGAERKAYTYFYHVLMRTAWKQETPALRELAEEAYRGLCALSGSEDECMWEQCSQVVGDLRDLFEQR